MKKLRLRKQVRTLIETINAITFMICLMMNDGDILAILTILSLFVSTSVIINIDNKRGW